MDGRGGCCITRYSGAAGAYDMSKVDLIMLRYRPIAPKPATGGSVSGGSTPENNEVYATGRGKRKYVRDNKRSNNRKRKASPDKSDPQTKTTSSGSASGGETVVTLPLLPETPDRKDRPTNSPIWLNFEGHVTNPDPTVVVMPQAVSLLGSCVTVECVTDTWVDWNGLGCTDEERMMNLERDTCPGIISDGLNRVMWTNKAYREMVGQVDGEVMVWLVTKECVSLPVRDAAFTCRVRVTCGKERNSLTTLPCDVWRMDGGGFAWRLDVKAALCLGR